MERGVAGFQSYKPQLIQGGCRVPVTHDNDVCRGIDHRGYTLLEVRFAFSSRLSGASSLAGHRLDVC